MYGRRLVGGSIECRRERPAQDAFLLDDGAADPRLIDPTCRGLVDRSTGDCFNLYSSMACKLGASQGWPAAGLESIGEQEILRLERWRGGRCASGLRPSHVSSRIGVCSL